MYFFNFGLDELNMLSILDLVCSISLILHSKLNSKIILLNSYFLYIYYFKLYFYFKFILLNFLKWLNIFFYSLLYKSSFINSKIIDFLRLKFQCLILNEIFPSLALLNYRIFLYFQMYPFYHQSSSIPLYLFGIKC